MSIGERIITLRKKSGLSQGQLAEMLGISRQAVSKWETDQSAPDTIRMIQLADILNTEIEYLATGRIPAKIAPVVVNYLNQPLKIQEKIVEKIIEVEKPVEIEKIVEVERIIEKTIEKPVIKRIIRYKKQSDPLELCIVGSLTFLAGLVIGFFL